MIRKMKTDISVMPEVKDKKFSAKLFRRFLVFAISIGVFDFVLEIKEKYSHEKTPHYHYRKGSIVNSHLFNTIRLTASYTATADDNSYYGKVDIILISNAPDFINQNLILKAFYFYDQYIREDYSEWQTIYKEITFS